MVLTGFMRFVGCEVLEGLNVVKDVGVRAVVKATILCGLRLRVDRTVSIISIEP